MRKLLTGSVLASICLFASGSEGKSEINGELMVFHAGSLAVPFKQVAVAFNREYPDVQVLLEAAGSRASARKISDLNRRADVFGSADHSVIDSLLIPEHALWNIRFAANEMVVAYTDHSRRAAEITSDNWYQILLDKNVAYGRSDPNADPCGYRTVLTTKLAEVHYGEPGLIERLLGKDQRHIRPKETDLLALLQVGEIDYIFIYRSVARQHGLKWVNLPDEINLKNPGMANLYSKVSVEVSGKAPGSFITKPGAPMVYGVTIPRDAPNPKAAMAFVSFLLEPDKGMAIMESNGQPSLIPSISSSYNEIPDSLKRFAKQP
jgi:molybdate/tungstate transport system substrate-binding protein